MDWKRTVLILEEERNYGEVNILGGLGLLLFFTGASSMDGNQIIGTVLTLAGLGLLAIEAKREGAWR